MLPPIIVATLVTAITAGTGSAKARTEQRGEHAGSDARQISLATPQTIVEIDTSDLKGQPVVLAWSSDGSDIYLQAVQRDRGGSVTSTRHYVVSVQSKTIKGVDTQPAWASNYWLWKSGQASPASASFKINVESRQETRRATAAVGDLAKGGGGGDGRGIPGTSADEAGAIKDQSQVLSIYALRLKGATLGEWTNEAVVPGLNFGWAPAPSHLIVYAKRDGGALTVLDDQGRKRELAGAKNAVLPGWSPDGRQLAWLERKDRRKLDLTIADISPR
jgi:Tol biopolymer transport system component